MYRVNHVTADSEKDVYYYTREQGENLGCPMQIRIYGHIILCNINFNSRPITLPPLYQLKPALGNLRKRRSMGGSCIPPFLYLLFHLCGVALVYYKVG